MVAVTNDGCWKQFLAWIPVSSEGSILEVAFDAQRVRAGTFKVNLYNFGGIYLQAPPGSAKNVLTRPLGRTATADGPVAGIRHTAFQITSEARAEEPRSARPHHQNIQS